LKVYLIGIEKGREEGREGMTEMLLMNIRFRFGKVSSEIENQIKSIKDTEKIRDLFTKSFSCNNEEQFLKLF